VDLSAYRVAQEAMTNALKHGGVGTIVTVTVRYAADNLELEILDDSRGKSYGSANDGPAGLKLAGGHGLVGMRERVALHGGRFEAGPRIGSGFAVHASFPLPAAAFRLAS
jgi:signal transduction histidine kinase